MKTNFLKNKVKDAGKANKSLSLIVNVKSHWPDFPLPSCQQGTKDTLRRFPHHFAHVYKI